MTKQTIALTDDNWRDYFSFSHVESIIKGVPVPTDGFDPNGREAKRLIEWVEEENAHPNSKVTWKLTKCDAAAVQNLVAGWDPVAKKWTGYGRLSSPGRAPDPRAVGVVSDRRRG